MRFTAGVLLLLWVANLTGAPSGYVYTNLDNPTNYVFHADMQQVINVLEKNKQQRLGSDLYLFRLRTDDYRFNVGPYYSPRYWRGRKESDDEIDPPEAGKIGQIEAWFLIKLRPQAAGTLVSIEVDKFQQQIGRAYAIFPHFRKVPKKISVKSDTYFEYFFLLKLGEILGEKNMPPLKGSDEEPAATDEKTQR